MRALFPESWWRRGRQRSTVETIWKVRNWIRRWKTQHFRIHYSQTQCHQHRSRFIKRSDISYLHTSKTSIKQTFKLNEQFDIYHLQYLNWPDFGEADDKLFLQFLSECHRLNLFSDPNHGPPIVHCSAGLGRSGTFVLVNTCLELVSSSDYYRKSPIPWNTRIDFCFKYKQSNNMLPCRVMDVLLELRRHRAGIVQTVAQLKFVDIFCNTIGHFTVTKENDDADGNKQKLWSS